MNPINLLVRFLLELSALAAIGIWGWKIGQGWTRTLWAIGIPLGLALIWGTFAVPNDPSRSGHAIVAVPGFLRLGLELAFFGFAAWAAYHSGHAKAALVFGAIVVVHYLFSYDRIIWLIHQ